jgi:hypothetical protein
LHPPHHTNDAEGGGGQLFSMLGGQPYLEDVRLGHALQLLLLHLTLIGGHGLELLLLLLVQPTAAAVLILIGVPGVGGVGGVDRREGGGGAVS